MSSENGLLSKATCRSRYNDALSKFAVRHQRVYMLTKGKMVSYGKGAGMSADEIIADAHAVGVENRDEFIRSLWDSSTMRPDDDSPDAEISKQPRKPRKAEPRKHPLHVRNMIGDVDAARNGCADWVRELSPCLDWIGRPPSVQTALWLRALYRPGELLHVTRIGTATAGRLGVNIRPASEWAQMTEDGKPLPGDGIIPQPLTGKPGTTEDGRPSFIANDAVADCPFVLIEFDDLPLPMQYGLWRGFVLSSKLAPALASVTYSGGKSLHALINVGCRTAADWNAVCARFKTLFCSDDEPTYRCDPQSLRIRQATRVPGVWRTGDNGRRTLQELVYLNPDARPGTMWTAPAPQPPPPIDPDGKPPCGDAFGMHLCGVCDRLRDCPFVTAAKGGAR